ncbi:MAG TPA: hypothetical protein DDY91_20835 [Planctomycetaceae bacterium]|nr:hypothetical protein [Planctomycetaceae bacterium]
MNGILAKGKQDQIADEANQRPRSALSPKTQSEKTGVQGLGNSIHFTGCCDLEGCSRKSPPISGTRAPEETGNGTRTAGKWPIKS